jgi:hypothetical protein
MSLENGQGIGLEEGLEVDFFINNLSGSCTWLFKYFQVERSNKTIHFVHLLHPRFDVKI